MSEENVVPVRDVFGPIVAEIRRKLEEQEKNLRELARRNGVEFNPALAAPTEAFIWKMIDQAMTNERIEELKVELFKLVTTGKGKTRKNRSAVA